MVYHGLRAQGQIPAYSTEVICIEILLCILRERRCVSHMESTGETSVLLPGRERETTAGQM